MFHSAARGVVEEEGSKMRGASRIILLRKPPRIHSPTIVRQSVDRRDKRRRTRVGSRGCSPLRISLPSNPRISVRKGSRRHVFFEEGAGRVSNSTIDRGWGSKNALLLKPPARGRALSLRYTFCSDRVPIIVEKSIGRGGDRSRSGDKKGHRAGVGLVLLW